uniref:Uncharacterized protein n=1 Tax=Chromera velia CCMP2878 TaxID=1169474 RepID=A0A0G4HHB0_9ALVE|eukprot:Cvel_27463.t1-p1 / transcript=Cvel_27463.t1 / gene=Cvel_27463 / organism=Chromera_velia_CCMP2878 / gene_product=hypothetical protein / transcript_product=hypothetical protein / location=Cvel_scaffold3429:7938-9836(-) / protein_length=196 / sequence_SO=supercontig / SO=protein_coding / is_pseudo=false
MVQNENNGAKGSLTGEGEFSYHLGDKKRTGAAAELSEDRPKFLLRLHSNENEDEFIGGIGAGLEGSGITPYPNYPFPPTTSDSQTPPFASTNPFGFGFHRAGSTEHFCDHMYYSPQAEVLLPEGSEVGLQLRRAFSYRRTASDLGKCKVEPFLEIVMNLVVHLAFLIFLGGATRMICTTTTIVWAPTGSSPSGRSQ